MSNATLEPEAETPQDTGEFNGLGITQDVIDTAAPTNETTEDFTEPSNEVHAKYGDDVLFTARRGIYNGVKPDELRKEILEKHKMPITLGDLRLLLASRNPIGRK